MEVKSFDQARSDSSIQIHPSSAIRFVAHVFSWIFHPLFIASYVISFLIYIHPAAFEGIDMRTKNFRMASVILYTVLFPGFSLFIAWRLKLIRDMHLRSRSDRLVGFIITMFFYFWTMYVFRNLPDTPPVAARFLLGTFLVVCGTWMCTIFYNVSLHAAAMGGVITFFILFGRQDPYVSGLYLALPVLIGGFVCSSRIVLGAHNRFEMVTGFIAGVLMQAIAWFF
jgi:hypothetical protein